VDFLPFRTQGTPANVLDVQGIIESRLHLPQFSPPTVRPPPMQQTTSPGFFSNLKAKAHEEISQVQAEREQQAQAQQEQQSSQCNELLSAFYTLNTKYRISWECAELLIELAGGVSASTRTASWGGGFSSAS
jgi:serine/arginine repetitive matrix protein 2